MPPRMYALTVHLSGPFKEDDYPFIPLEPTATKLSRLRDLLQEGVLDARDNRWYPPHRIHSVSLREVF